MTKLNRLILVGFYDDLVGNYHYFICNFFIILYINLIGNPR